MPRRSTALQDWLARATALLLLMAVALVLVLAVRARAEFVAHRQPAERALREYAAFAAWQLSSQMRAELQGETFRAFSRVAVTIANPAAPAALPLDDFAADVRQAAAGCPCLDAVRFHYRIDLRGAGLALSPSSGLPPEWSQWLSDTLIAVARRSLADGASAVLRQEFVLSTDRAPRQPPASEPGARPSAGRQFRREERVLEERAPRGGALMRTSTRALIPSVVVADVAGRPTAFVQAVLHDASGTPAWVYGVATDPSRLFAPVFMRSLDHDRLLPPSITRGRPAREILSIQVVGPGGAPVYTAGSPPTVYSATDTLPDRYGSLRVSVALDSALAEQLLVGDLPRSRLPGLLAMLGLTIGLIGITTLQLRRQAALARMRTDFVSGVSHELRTPLAQIRLLAELLTMGQPPSEEDRRESARIIDQEARRLSHLVQNVLTFSHTERRVARVAPAPADLGEEVSQVVRAFLPLARAEDVTIEEALPTGIVASIDRFALRQIVNNLLDNAVRYGGNARRVQVAARARAGFGWLIVSDQGPGVPAGERQRIWEPYYRLERDAVETRGGSGIGLSVVRELVLQHGGQVSVRNRPDGGAEFSVAFPLHVPAARSAESVAAGEEHSPPSSQAIP